MLHWISMGTAVPLSCPNSFQRKSCRREAEEDKERERGGRIEEDEEIKRGEERQKVKGERWGE